MKYLAALIILLFLISSNKILQAQWTQLNGPGGSDVTCLAVSGTKIIAGTPMGGVFLSTDTGSNWKPVNNGMTNLWINTLILSGNNIFAGTEGDGVYLSTNDGANWTQVNNGLFDHDVYCFAINGDNIFAGTYGGIYLSTNNGTNWTQLISIPVMSLVINGSN